MNDISAIIVIKDNPPHVHESIDSIYDFVNEIIVADIGMEKKLKDDLSKMEKIRIIETPSVSYVELIREKLKKYANQTYVLFLDPDEIIPHTLMNEWNIQYHKYDYIATPRKNIIFGKWIRQSRWWPDYQIRLFKKQSVVWPTLIHKQPKVTGTGYTMEKKEEYAILHHNYESIDEYLTKAMRYAKSESTNLVSGSNPPTLNSTVKSSISEFVSRFFAGQGYKDGLHGFILSFFQMIYPFLVYFYYLESIKYSTLPTEKDLIGSSISFSGKLYQESLYWKAKKSKITLKEKIIEKLIDSNDS